MSTPRTRRRPNRPASSPPPGGALQDAPLLLARLVTDATSLAQLEQALVSFAAALEKRVPCRRIEIWLHDRNTHQLRCLGSGRRMPADEEGSPLGRALRQTNTEVLARRSASTLTLLTPIRGRRRALGVLRIAGLRSKAETASGLVASLDGIAWHVASLIEHVQLLTDVLRARDQLAQSEKLAALGQFVAGIAHEINNPLQGIIGHVELIRAQGGLSPQAQRDLRLVEREADRAARIVRDLLVFARTGSLQTRKPLQVTGVLDRVLRLRAAACRTAGIRVTRRLPAGLPKVAGDALLLHQAFLNLVLNAEQAMAARGGGRLSVLARKVERAGVAVEIRDTGPGIPEDVMPRIFEPFFTTKSVGQGTGLGLTLTYGIIREHGGKIDVTNYASGGVAFTVYLPSLIR